MNVNGSIDGHARQRSRFCTPPARSCGLSVLLAAAIATTLPHAGHAATPFDGTWSVVQDCPTAPDGARGYKWLYDAVVKDGNLVGEYGTKGKPSSLTLTGTIAADGTARLAASGLTGESDRTVGYMQSGSKFYFTVDAKFSGTKGTGSRLAGRTCNFTFTKK